MCSLGVVTLMLFVDVVGPDGESRLGLRIIFGLRGEDEGDCVLALDGGAGVVKPFWFRLLWLAARLSWLAAANEFKNELVVFA